LELGSAGRQALSLPGSPSVIFPYRDDNPRESFPMVTVAIIAVNVLVQLYQLTMSPERAVLFLRSAGAIPFEIVTLTDIVRFPDHPRALLPIPLTLLSSLFVHGGWVHLVGNMWYLWIFGDNIEDSTGHLRYLLFYLLVGLVAAMAQVLMDPSSTIPMVGASGAIAGVLGAYALLYPRSRIHCIVPIIVIFWIVRIPALVVLGFWFVLQLLRGLESGPASGVAWFAHIGGFIAGLLLIKLFVSRRHPDRSAL
jgi:membrane associated rhomboid family serine protease